MKRPKRNNPANQTTQSFRSSSNSRPFLSKSNRITVAIIACFLIFGLIFLFFLSRDLPSLTLLEQYEPELSTKLYSRDGKVIKELFIKKRTYTSLDSIPTIVKQAVIATEDRDFYSHWGFNSKRFIKAMIVDILAMRYKQGASTLSQQLARSLYLTPEKTLTRKMKELLTAIQIERTYTKDEIFEMYLNQIYFGHGAYGVQAAAHQRPNTGRSSTYHCPSPKSNLLFTLFESWGRIKAEKCHLEKYACLWLYYSGRL